MVRLGIRTNIETVKGKNIFIPEEWREFAGELANEFGKRAQRSIRYRAPYATGNLWRNIKLDKNKGALTRFINVDLNKVPYFKALEKGHWTGHWIPLYYVQQHYASNGTIRPTRISKDLVKQSGGWFYSSSVHYSNGRFTEKGFNAAKRNFSRDMWKAYKRTMEKG